MEEKKEKKEKELESKMDQTAKKFTETVADGVKKIEDAFEKGKENLREDIKGSEGMQNLKGSPRMGFILLGLGFAWLLNTFGLFGHWVFPVILMIVGIYFMLRSR